MRWSQCHRVVLMYSLCLTFGCCGVENDEGRSIEMYRALHDAWPRYVANSISCHDARSLAQHDEACRELFDYLRRCGYELEWVYCLTDWFLLEARSCRNGELKWLKLGRNPLNGDMTCRTFDLQEKSWINVCSYAGALRFAPIVADTVVGFTEMWDSVSDSIVCVPNGFHALIQGGAGWFLLRKDADGEYYRWNAVSGVEPKRWKYYFPAGCNPRSSFFIALSSETGKRYAFAVGLEPIPNSEGAFAISPCGAYKGRQYYGISKEGNAFIQYYAWPEKGHAEPLSNGTETFGGCSVAVRNGRLVVLSSTGPVDVVYWSGGCD